MAATIYYKVYLNTMIFAIVAGVVSMILLLALIYVPSVSNYSILILTVQIGLIAIVIQALFRIWWTGRKDKSEMDTSNQNALSVGFCPDYMVSGVNDPSVGGGTNCTNQYAGTTVQIWTGTGVPVKTAPFNLAQLDSQPIANVCAAANLVTQSTTGALLSVSTANVPWTELRSRCKTFSYT